MDVQKAKQIVRAFDRKSKPSDEDIFMATEALSFLISELKDPKDMLYLGGIYYEMKEFDLARKYYEMSAEYDFEPAHACLGYIYYYGRTGDPDYEKAFLHFEKSAEQGNLQSAYKVADMYKNGYYVPKDYAKYVQIIEELWPKVEDAQYTEEPFPEVATRLAAIRAKQGKTEEAIDLYLRAKSFLEQRIQYHPFFGNFSIMKWLVRDLYELMPLDEDNMDFYDLYEVLKNPCTVTFYFKNKPYDVVSEIEGDTPVISFDGKYYRDIDDFMQQGTIGDEAISSRAHQFYYFEVKRD